MDAIINNPFRVLGISPSATDKEIAKRTSDLIIYAEMDKKVTYDTDFLFLGEVNRSVSNIQEASKKLEMPENRLYYSLLWFNLRDEKNTQSLKILGNIHNILLDKALMQKLKNHNEKNPTSYLSTEDAKKRLSEKDERKVRESLLRSLSLEDSTHYKHIKIPVYYDIISQLPVNTGATITNDRIVLDSKEESGFWLLKELKFDKNVHFSIEFECEWIEGEENKLYSIIFGKDLTNSYYSLGVSANGYIFFDVVEKGIYKNIFGWKKDDAVNKLKNKLILYYRPKIRRFQIYINERPFPYEYNVVIEKEIVFFGDYIGLSVLGKQKVSFSNFKIFYSTGRTTFGENIDFSKKYFPAATNTICYLLTSHIRNEWNIAYDPEKAIILMGKLINSESIYEYSKTICDENFIPDKNSLSMLFINDVFSLIKQYIDKDEGIRLKEFTDAFHTFSDEIQLLVLSKFIGKPIVEIEKSIAETKKIVETNPAQANVLGIKLFTSTNNNLNNVKEILSYGNLQYRLIANKLSEALIDCSVGYWNAITKTRKPTLHEGFETLKTITYADKIVVDGTARQRVSDNLIFIKNWISIEENKTI